MNGNVWPAIKNRENTSYLSLVFTTKYTLNKQAKENARCLRYQRFYHWIINKMGLDSAKTQT